MNRLIVIFTALVMLTSLPLVAQSIKQAKVLGESALYKKPFSDAEVVTKLQSGSEVTVIKRKGGWYQVKTAKSMSGWMRMSKLRFGEQKSDQQSGNIKGLQQTISLFQTGRSGTSGVTVATGIRGLDAADLANSEPDHQALERLLKFMSDRQGSEQFAARAKLKRQEIAFIQVEKSNDNEPKTEEDDSQSVEDFWNE